MSQPFKLYRLQQIDSQLDWARARLKEIEAALQADQTVLQATQNAEASANKHRDALRALRQAEEEVRQQRLKIEQTESTLYGGKVRNPKELQDLQKESAALKRYLSVLEDRQLEAMLVEEDASGENDLVQAQLAQVNKDFEARSLEFRQESQRCEKDVARLEEERRATISSIPSEDLQIYEMLRTKRRGLAVAKVTARACSACGSTLNAALLQAAHSPNQLTRCDACGRILYLG